MNNELELLQRINKLEREINNLKRIEIPNTAFCGARYTTDAGQSINNGATTIVNFEDKDYDTDNAVTTGASWKFTAPTAGYYHTSSRAMFALTTTWAETEVAELYIYVNGAVKIVLGRSLGVDTSASGNYVAVWGSATVYLSASQYIDVRVYQDSGAALTLYNVGLYNWVSIDRVG